MGKHVCPNCAKSSRLEFRLSQFLLTAIVMAIIVVPFAFLLERKFGGYWDVLGLVPGIIVGLPLDKWLDEKYRMLKPVKNGDNKNA